MSTAPRQAVPPGPATDPAPAPAPMPLWAKILCGIVLGSVVALGYIFDVPEKVNLAGHDLPIPAPAAKPAPAGPRQVLLPKAGIVARFVHRDSMRPVAGLAARRAVAAWPAPTLPVTWYAGLTFPILGNDRWGDCGAAMIAHADQTYTGANGAESTFNTNALVNQYLARSGGDNGLDEADVIAIGKAGIAGDPQAVIYDAIDIDPGDHAGLQAAIQQYGGVWLAMSCPDEWINDFDPAGGTVFDAAPANPNNGHYVLLNGVDAKGRYRLQTWGSWAWLTPSGLDGCQPQTTVAFSPRWFGAKGVDPTGATYAAKARLWAALGGNALPPGPTPAPTPEPAPPGPTPPPKPDPGPGPAALNVVVSGTLTLASAAPAPQPPPAVAPPVTCPAVTAPRPVRAADGYWEVLSSDGNLHRCTDLPYLLAKVAEYEAARR